VVDASPKSTVLKIGDKVKLLSVPEWLVRDLPDDEVEEIRSFVGGKTTIESIDVNGYWIGFGNMTDQLNSSNFSGHSFCVEAFRLRKL
jgi:hypothetical protein